MWRFTATVEDGKGRPHRINSSVEADNFKEAYDAAMKRIFEILTRGDAQFGHPGEGGCTGPYKILGFGIERLTQ